jgi:predicted amidohydrolase
MRVALAELAPRPLEPAANLARLVRAVRSAGSELVVFPELFLSGYRLGDRLRTVALRPEDGAWSELAELGRSSRSTIVLGAATVAAERDGEVENTAIVVDPTGNVHRQAKRYLPTFGPFEEGLVFTPTDRSVPISAGGVRLGLEICYDVFFPEVTRELAIGGADLLINVSASPTTSRPLFDKLLPARAVENGLPVVYVNRVGVEDGLVFGGGSGAWDPRGEPIPLSPIPFDGLSAGERFVLAEVDLAAAARWRPFRPVLRDVAARPPARASVRP